MGDQDAPAYAQARKRVDAVAVLLICGILAPILYVVADVLGALSWQGYSYTSQSISELKSLGSPSRSLVVPLAIVDDVLVIAFALGVWAAANAKRALRVTAGLLIGIAAVGLTTTFFGPIHQRGGEAAFGDALHIALTIVTVLFILLAVGFAANAFGKRFLFYSIGTIVVLIVFGALAGLDGPRMAAQLPTPWLGVTERINVGAYLLWMAALAIAVLRDRDAGSRA